VIHLIESAENGVLYRKKCACWPRNFHLFRKPEPKSEHSFFRDSSGRNGQEFTGWSAAWGDNQALRDACYAGLWQVDL